MTEPQAQPTALAQSLRIERFPTRRTGRCAVRGPVDPAAVRELWIVLHGYGQLASGFVGGFGAVDDGTRLIVAPEGLSRFYDARTPLAKHAEAEVGASWMTREDRAEEIEDHLHWLGQVLETYRARVQPAAALTLLGFSQGAAAASRWVARGTVSPDHLICWGASIAPEIDLGADAPIARTRCTVVIGDRDIFVSAERIAAERARLDAAGFVCAFERFAGGHRLDDATLARVARPAAAPPPTR
jgi:predicted esterase